VTRPRTRACSSSAWGTLLDVQADERLACQAMSDIVLQGRSSSHFTRTARIFALELGVPHAFRAVLDLTTIDAANYADNPALKIPILIDQHGPLFGTENICRELVRRSTKSPNVVMRGDASDRLIANAEELVLHVMNAEVTIITAKMAGASTPPKVLSSIENSVGYLDDRIETLLPRLPSSRELSFFEVSLFCAVTHLPFRQILDTSRWKKLTEFAQRFGQRASARSTAYQFDAA
jgi:glutathione S-transferase